MKKSKKSKTINVSLAPYNWKRLKSYVDQYNEHEDRIKTSVKFTDVINEALFLYFKEMKIKNSMESTEDSNDDTKKN